MSTESTKSTTGAAQPDHHREEATNLVRQQLHGIYDGQAATQPNPNTVRHAQHYNPFSNRPNPSADRQAYEKWYYTLTPEQQQQEWQHYFNARGPQQEKKATRSAPSSPSAKPSSFATFSIPQPDNSPAQQPANPTSATQQVSQQVQAEYNSELNQKTIVGAAPQEHKDETKPEDIRERILNKVREGASDKTGIAKKLKPLGASLVVGGLFLLVFYNEFLTGQIKQYLSPGSIAGVSTTIVDPATISTNVGSEAKIIIPKINLDVPVVYDIKGYDEAEIQAGLERGVVHYGETALPGQTGNNVILGHSSSNYFNAGKYKFAFVFLDLLEIGDTFFVHYGGTRYVYKVSEKKVVQPDDFSVVQPTATPTATLITCTPPGTSWQRLILHADQISPDPAKAQVVETSLPGNLSNTSPVPGNSPSLFRRLTDWIFG